jgi:hypothetical protein
MLCLVKGQPPAQTKTNKTPFIASLHNGTWADNTLAAITDKKGVTHLYLHNPGLEPVEIQRKMVVDMADKPDTFHINMLVNKGKVAGIFGTEAAMFWSGPPSHNGAGQPPTQVKRAMIRDAVICSVTPKCHTQFEALLTRHADVISESKTNLGQSDRVIHNIELTGHVPVYTKQFPLPPDHYEKIWRKVREWVKIGVCKPANSKYNSPIFCVVKKAAKHWPKDTGQADMRVVLDYRRMNIKSSLDRYSIHGMEECIQEVGFAWSKYFTLLDLTASFWQIMLAKVAHPYTAFTVPGEDQFQWQTSLMGLISCPASFSGLMDMVMWGLKNVLTIDDILVHSPDMPDHLTSVRWTNMASASMNTPGTSTSWTSWSRRPKMPPTTSAST